MEKNTYNDIYSKLVEENDDKIIGIIAYAIYKQSKIEWVKNFIKEQGKNPTEIDFNNFYKIISTETNLNGFKTQAYDFLNEYLDVMQEEIEEEAQEKIQQLKQNFEKKIKEIEKKYQKEFEERLKSELDPATKKAYFHSILQNIIASFLTIALIGFFYFVIFTTKNVNPQADVVKKVDKSVHQNNDNLKKK
jgi:DNA-binding transcriptional MerR regulator